jgi:hypothetical protein
VPVASPPSCVGLSRTRLFSLTHLPLLLLPTRAPPTAARRSTLHARPTQHTRHPGKTLRSHLCRAPFLSHHVQAYCNALAPPASPLRLAVVPARWVSVDLCGVFSHGHPGSMSCAQHGEFVWCACSGTSLPPPGRPALRWASGVTAHTFSWSRHEVCGWTREGNVSIELTICSETFARRCSVGGIRARQGALSGTPRYCSTTES